MNAKADWLKKDGEILVPKTLTSCVFDANGNSVDKIVEDIKESIPTNLSQLTEDSGHRTVTDEQIIKWNQGGAEVESVTVINVKNHGVKGDGSTDDTEAIQSLLDTIDSGATLYFPQGLYKITDTLVVKNHLNIIGETRYGGFTSTANKIHSASTLNYVGDANKSLLTKDSASYINLSIQNMSFYGNSYTVEETGHKSKANDYGKYYVATSTKEDVNGVDLSNTNGAFFIADCYFQGFSGNALIATQHKKIFNCGFYKCNVGILPLTYDCLIDYCWFSRCSIGVLTTNNNTLAVYNSWFDQMEQHAIKGTSQLMINMNSCWIDMVDYSAINVTTTLTNSRIDARMSRCAMAYAGAIESEIAKEDMYKACTIFAHLGQSCYINVTPQRRTIDGTNNTGICPTATFGSDSAIKDSIIICPTNTNDNLEDHLALTNTTFKNCIILDGMQIKKQLGAYSGSVPYIVVRNTNPPTAWKAMNKGDLWFNTEARTLFVAIGLNAGDYIQIAGGGSGEAEWNTIVNKPSNLLLFVADGDPIEFN